MVLVVKRGRGQRRNLSEEMCFCSFERQQQTEGRSQRSALNSIPTVAPKNSDPRPSCCDQMQYDDRWPAVLTDNSPLDRMVGIIL